MNIPMKDWRFIGCTAEYASAGTVLFGAPFDGTVSYRPGTRFAPAHMRMESFGIETYSPALDEDLENAAVCDVGDIDIPIGNTAESLALIGALTANILRDGKKPVMIGGEHLVSVPAIEAATKAFPGLAVLHFDAHTDLRMDYLGEKLSHSTAMRRVHEFTGDDSIWQFGIRSGMAEEFHFATEHTHLCRNDLSGLKQAVETIGSRPVYLTIDLDVLDPSIFPGTGTPEAGGISYAALQEGLLLLRSLNLIGADVVELSPHYDHSGVSTAVACKVLREVLLLLK